MAIDEETKSKICETIYKTIVTDSNGKEHKTLRFDKVILTSGKLSVFYIDHRVLPSVGGNTEPILRAMEQEIWNLADHAVTHIISSSEAGIYWGSCVSRNLALGFSVMRKNGKLMGPIPKGAIVTGVDDLNTTLGTLNDVIELVKSENAEMVGYVINIDREEYVPEFEEKFNGFGVPLMSLVTGRDLIDYGLMQGLIDQEQKSMVEAYRRDPDQFAIKIIQENPEWVKIHDRFEKVKAFYANNETVKPFLESIL